MELPSLLVEHEYETYNLNKHFVNRQDAWEQVPELIKVHKEKLDIFMIMKDLEDPEMLRKCADQVTEKEFELQRLWGLPEDRNGHDWYMVPKCECPKMDNHDYKGTKYSVRSGNCPIHSISAEDKK